MKYYEEEPGLYIYHDRFYKPTLARFLQVDPMHQGFSPYVYVGDMPDEFTDPSGMSWQDTLGSALSIVGGVAANGPQGRRFLQHLIIISLSHESPGISGG